MSKRKEPTRAPQPLEEYIEPFDSLLGKWNQAEFGAKRAEWD